MEYSIYDISPTIWNIVSMIFLLSTIWNIVSMIFLLSTIWNIVSMIFLLSFCQQAVINIGNFVSKQLL